MEENKNNVEGTEGTIVKEEQETSEDVKMDEENGATNECDDEMPLKHKDKKKVKKLEAEIEKIQAQLAEEQDKYMRLYAEYDNFRRRSAKEREGIYADAYSDALSQILPIIDNLERAAQYSAEDPDSSMAKGIELTIKSCVEALNKMGVYEIEALGKTFDPNFHNAVLTGADPEKPENIILNEYQEGFILKNDRVIRHSMVKVAN